MKIKDIMALQPKDISKMTTQQLLEAVVSLAQTVNKTYINILRSDFGRESEHGYGGQAAASLAKSGGILSTKVLKEAKQEYRQTTQIDFILAQKNRESAGTYKNRNELVHELNRGIQFYASQGHSVSGLKAQRKAAEARLGHKFKSIKEYNEFWRSYNRFMELNPFLDSSQVQEYMISSDEDFEDIDISDILKYSTSLYEKEQERLLREQEERSQRHGTSNFVGPSNYGNNLTGTFKK